MVHKSTFFGPICPMSVRNKALYNFLTVLLCKNCLHKSKNCWTYVCQDLWESEHLVLLVYRSIWVIIIISNNEKVLSHFSKHTDAGSSFATRLCRLPVSWISKVLASRILGILSLQQSAWATVKLSTQFATPHVILTVFAN